MLIIVMHNRQDYLESLLSLARKEDITDTTIIKKENIGIRLIGEQASFIYSKGSLSKAYDKALLVTVRGEEKTRHFLDLIEHDTALGRLNLEDKGFICTVPFQQVKNLELESSYLKREKLRINVGDYLREDRVLLDLKTHSKEESIREVAVLLKGAKEMIDFDTFLKDVFEREKLATTGIGNEIAIPHARTDAVKDFVIAFGRSPQGVEFNSLDNKPAKLIFLMGTPKEERLGIFLKILANLTGLLKEESFRDSLMKANSPKELVDQFKRIQK